jgi:hypothetical protein
MSLKAFAMVVEGWKCKYLDSQKYFDPPGVANQNKEMGEIAGKPNSCWIASG